MSVENAQIAIFLAHGLWDLQVSGARTPAPQVLYSALEPYSLWIEVALGEVEAILEEVFRRQPKRTRALLDQPRRRGPLASHRAPESFVVDTAELCGKGGPLWVA